MGRKNTLLPNDLACVGERSIGMGREKLTRELECEKRRVALDQVKNRGCNTELSQEAYAADTEDLFLDYPCLNASAVEMSGD
jgi:hypothetical protein